MSTKEFYDYWKYASIVEVVKNLLFAVAMFITSYQHKPSSINQSQLPFLDMDMN